jgi:hypothetical protein
MMNIDEHLNSSTAQAITEELFDALSMVGMNQTKGIESTTF